MHRPHDTRMSLAEAQALIDAHGFATLTDDRLRVSHLPLVLARDEGPLGSLYGHFARANPHWHGLEGRRVLAVFQGPHAYVSPRWYVTRPAVPTWHYVAVHARGVLERLDDAATLASMEALVAHHEPGLREDTALGDAAYRRRLLAGVVGFRIRLDDLQGKAKLGLHRSSADQAGVLAGLDASGDPLARRLGRYTRRCLEDMPGSEGEEACR
ncbi:FMN-binding negative transcriptional regulator [Halomonas koreensis]|uniref:FMN-binding negative transcriptional regulator n=1 Tax=Halomonas koreensis TaxID=245385 RepID=A0ABU1G197_9GAMM|nr:FMN-binding negative transcriptional regulator [Halomonas koreensis]MDR5866696.1 FMN-binding negative transcriptional regulator [Halomonas koreensis]